MTKPLRVAYLAPGMGSVTHTFVHREMAVLERMGVEVIPFSTTPALDAANAEETRDLRARTFVLYDLNVLALICRALMFGLRHPIRVARAKLALAHDILVAETPNIVERVKLLWHFCAAAVLAAELERRRVHHLHIHFAHVPASIGMYAAGMARIPYSFTAHANDIFVRPVALREKVARSAFCACISHYNTRYLTGKGCDAAKLVVVRCGLDSAEYAYTPPSVLNGPVRIFSVGRLIEKKGFVPLLGALARVRDAGIAFQCQIVGDGPLMETLKQRIAELQLDGQVELLGSQPQERVKALLSCATVFALPCIVAQDGDQDGIPVALMEAMALGIPVVSCPVSGVPELIQDGRDGLLAPPHDESRLAEALGRLASDTDLRSRLAEAARARIEREFDSHQSAGLLLGLFTKTT